MTTKLKRASATGLALAGVAGVTGFAGSGPASAQSESASAAINCEFDYVCFRRTANNTVRRVEHNHPRNFALISSNHVDNNNTIRACGYRYANFNTLRVSIAAESSNTYSYRDLRSGKFAANNDCPPPG